MSTFQQLLDDIALVVGGTKQTAPPIGFYSGAQQGDGTGVSGLNGCYSMAPLAFNAAPPIGIVVAKSYTAILRTQGPEENRDIVKLLILVAKLDSATDLAILNPFRDSVPAAFRAHLQTDQIAGATALTPEPLFAFPRAGQAGGIAWAGITYWGWSFDIEILRMPIAAYSP